MASKKTTFWKLLKAEYWVQNILISDAYDCDLMINTMKNIVKGKTVEIPIYDYVTNARLVLSLPIPTPPNPWLRALYKSVSR